MAHILFMTQMYWHNAYSAYIDSCLANYGQAGVSRY